MYTGLIDYIDRMTKGNVPVIIRKEDIIGHVDAHPTPSIHDVQVHLQRAGYGAKVVMSFCAGVYWGVLIVYPASATITIR